MIEFDRLVTTIHRAPQDKRCWKDMVTQLLGYCEASFVNFLIRRPHDLQHGLEYMAGGTCFPDMRCRYRDRFEAIDPIRYFELPAGKITDLEDIYGPADYRQDTFYRDFLEPWGMARLLVVRCCEPGGISAWLTLGRRSDEPEFADDQRRRLQALSTHVTIALGNWAIAETARLERDVYAGVAAALQVQPLVLDDDGRLLDLDICHNALASARGNLTIDKTGRPRARTPGDDVALQHHLRRLCGDDGPASAFLRLGQDADSATDVMLARLPAPTRLFRGRVPRIAAFLRHGSAAFDGASIAALFKLSGREAELAAKLAAGVRLADASAQLGITTETGRTYAKRVLSKTGLGSQTELVRSILNSAASLAGAFQD